MTLKRKLLWFLGCSFLLGVAAGVAAWLFAGETGVLFVGTAFSLCLVPMTATLIWSSWAFQDTPRANLLAVMGGTSFRMLFVMAVGVALFLSVPVYREASFMFWVVFFYLATLAVEVVLLVGKPSSAGRPTEPPPQGSAPLL